MKFRNIVVIASSLSLVSTLGCSDGDAVDTFFNVDGGGDTEFVEIPPENDLTIDITSPSEDGKPTGYQKVISGTCGTAGIIINITGDATAFSVCGVDQTWSVTLDTSSAAIGDITIYVRMVDGEVIGNPATRVLNKFSTACDTETARSDTFANTSTTGVPPWQICTPTQLSNIGNTYRNDDVELHNDLDFGSGTLASMTATNNGGYTGTFEGNSFTISNMVINGSANQQGIFREVTNATFQNLFFENTSVRGTRYVGILAGYVEVGNLVVNNVHAKNTYLETTESGNNGDAGTLFGASRDGASSMNFTNVTSTGVTIPTAKNNYGGIIGHINNITGLIQFEDVHVIGGQIDGRANVGGVVGNMSSSIDPTNVTFSNISNSANLSATAGTCGGIAGYGVGNFLNIANTGSITRSGGSQFGGLFGYFRNGTVSGSSTVATRQAGNTPPTIPTDGLPTVDGNGDIVSCYNTGSILAGGGDRAGGIIGFNYRDADGVSSCYNTGQVIGGNNYVGGVVGYAETLNLNDSLSTGNITGDGDYVGGLAGRVENRTTDSSITDSYASGTIITNGLSPRYVGGAVGRFEGAIGITDTYFNGTIESINGDDSDEVDYFGGLVGHMTSTSAVCTRCDSAGTMTISLTANTTNHRYYGGLIGFNSADISDSSSSMDITAELGDRVGGLVGHDNQRTIANSSASGNIVGRRLIGGLVGYVANQNTVITDSQASGNVTSNYGGGNTVYAGGLVGASGGSIFRSWASGDVSALDGDYVGGLAGGRNNNWSRTIEGCFATGNVDAGTDSEYVGGLVGYFRGNTDRFIDNFATGTVRGGRRVGGLVGFYHRINNNSMRRNYAIAQVIRATGGTGTDAQIGPLVGQISGSTAVIDSTSNFYNSDFMPLDESTGLAITSPNLTNVNPLTSAQMQVSGNFTNFDFGTPVWEMPSGGLILPGESLIYIYPVQEWVE